MESLYRILKKLICWDNNLINKANFIYK